MLEYLSISAQYSVLSLQATALIINIDQGHNHHQLSRYLLADTTPCVI